MKLSTDRHVSYFKHSIYDARSACFDWHDGVKTAMYRAVHDEADVRVNKLLKEAYACKLIANGMKKVDPWTHRDLDALIWWCMREIKLPEVEALINQAAEMAAKYDMPFERYKELIAESKNKFL